MQEVQEYFTESQAAEKRKQAVRKCSYDLLEHHRGFNKCDENVNYTRDPLLLTSSDEDSSGSPTNEMSNCIKFMEKPTLIKRFALGFLRSTEDSLPLMCHKSSPTSPQRRLNDILSEEQRTERTSILASLDQIVSSKFGDSCKQSFAGSQRALPAASAEVGVEYEFKRNLIRQTNSASSSPKRFPAFPQPPKHADSLSSVAARLGDPTGAGSDDREEELDRAAWFQAGLPREVSLEVLTQQSPGAFLVRRSTTKHGCFALSLRVPPGPGPKVVHYLIMKTERGYKIKGFMKEFSSLRALITHHSVMPEMLPVPLSLPRPQNIPTKCKHTDDYDTYSTLNEFSKLFSDLDICS
ncbi:EGFR adapter protein-like [Anopheles bellator]|uniref:EGFR adapter protein-like n=1 Tax=Anopheles bellator TaxID=139047 RepID=UPI0026484241|nr:EGFR adapter protein-like [Anopheles bellator]